ncbi:MAG: hypothetical protein JO270_04450 [Acidobacteriaceae bacterium]|nr:hypothetical protein [Acidobacteriaceae bacterium]
MSFDITPDGKQLVFDGIRENSDMVLIELPKELLLTSQFRLLVRHPKAAHQCERGLYLTLCATVALPL